MEIKASIRTAMPTIMIVTVAIAILAVDTQIDVAVDIPVLYVAVVLMSVRVYERRGVVVVALVCIVFTVVGYALSPGDLWERTVLADRFLAFLAIGATAYLALRNQSAENALNKAQTELAHVTRVTTLGELSASIAHEVNQPLAAIVTNGEVGLQLLNHDVPDLAEVRQAIGDMVSNARRAGEIILRIRALSKKNETQKEALDINEVIEEVIPLVRGQTLSHRVSLRLGLAPKLPAVHCDRVQLQQVIINLVVNGIEAMAPVTDRPRELVIRSQLDDTGAVLVTVQDSGVGINPETVKQIFNAFFTSKPSGMGMGLSICRSIIEAHGGRLSASGNVGQGASFQFALPTDRQAAS